MAGDPLPAPGMVEGAPAVLSAAPPPEVLFSAKLVPTET